MEKYDERSDIPQLSGPKEFGLNIFGKDRHCNKNKCPFPDADDQALRNGGGAFNTYLCSVFSKVQEAGFVSRETTFQRTCNEKRCLISSPRVVHLQVSRPNYSPES